MRLLVLLTDQMVVAIAIAVTVTVVCRWLLVVAMVG